MAAHVNRWQGWGSARSAHINWILPLYVSVSKRCHTSSPWSAVTPRGTRRVIRGRHSCKRGLEDAAGVVMDYITASAIRIKSGFSPPQKS